jgi:hypothetical protein
MARRVEDVRMHIREYNDQVNKLDNAVRMAGTGAEGRKKERKSDDGSCWIDIY